MISEFPVQDTRGLVAAVATAVGLRSKGTQLDATVPSALPPELAPWYLPGPDPGSHEGHAVLVVIDVPTFEDSLSPYRLDFVAIDRLMAMDGWHTDDRGMVHIGEKPEG